jgi:hypothetical protein
VWQVQAAALGLDSLQAMQRRLATACTSISARITTQLAAEKAAHDGRAVFVCSYRASDGALHPRSHGSSSDGSGRLQTSHNAAQVSSAVSAAPILRKLCCSAYVAHSPAASDHACLRGMHR